MFSTARMKVDGDQKINRNINMIKLFHQNRDYDSAKSYVNDLLALKPDSSEAYKLLSQINEAMGDHDLAMKNYKKAIELKVANDQNSSFESNRQQFTPTKLSSPVFGNRNQLSTTSLTPQENNHVNHQMANVESIERLLERKMAVLEKSCERINHNIVQMNENFNKNSEEVSSIKKKIVDMEIMLALVGSKQDELINKLFSMSNSSKNNDEVKEQLKTFSQTLGNLSDDNSKIIDELYNLKEAVRILTEKNNSDYDEDENYNDYEEDNDDERPLNLGEQPKLDQLFKKSDKDSWKCSVCDTPNSNSEPACVCCENPNPNSAKPLVKGIGDNESSSPFKFGVPSGTTSGFSFGSPAPQKPNSALPTFPVSSNVASNAKLVAPTATTIAPPSATLAFPSFGSSSFNTASSNANSSYQLLPQTTSVATSTSAFSTTPSFGTSSTLSSLLNGQTASSSFTTTTTSFSFANTLHSLKNSLQNSLTKSNAGSSGSFSFGNTVANSSAASSTPATSSFSFSLNSTNQNAANTTTSAVNCNSALVFPKVGTNDFSFSPLSNSNSFFSNSSKTASTNNFSFGNMSFNSNLFSSQQPNANLVKQESKNDKTATSKADEGYEHGADNAQDGDYFKLPDVKLPEKYDQVTGEEDEETAFEKKAKLFIFKDGEFKERGIGIFKILKHSKTFKYRVLMRRDHIFKVCLNAHLSDLINLEIIEDKFIRFSCIDFSEDKPDSGVFLLRFGSVVLLPEFIDLVKSLKSGTMSDSTATPAITANATTKHQSNNVDTSEVELVYTKQPKPEHVEMIKKLLLPPNFYDYEDKVPCKGCIGCDVDAINWKDLTHSEPDKTDAAQPAASTDLGLFSSIATDMNVTENKVDTIATNNDDVADNDHMKDKSFVSEKSKLLPENFEIKTGEEDEEIIFNERSKIYHFVGGEWKERGVGNMKILKRKDSNAFRLLMRRDRIFNVICNHVISEHLKLTPFQNSSNTLSWYARDFSEESDGIDELFALKFRNEVLVKQFESSVNYCIQKTSS